MILKEWIESEGINYFEICIKSKNNIEVAYGDPRVVYNYLGVPLLRAEVSEVKRRPQRHIAYLKIDIEIKFNSCPFKQQEGQK